MRKGFFPAGLLVLLCLLLTAGCGKQQQAPAADTAAGASAVSVGASAVVSKVPSAAVSRESSAVSSQITDRLFCKRWSDNPLDTAFQKTLKTADTQTKQQRVYEDFTNRWKKAVSSAYQRLMTVSGNDAALKEEQAVWKQNQQKVLDSFCSGSSAASEKASQIRTAKRTMAYYRDRAQRLYYELYQYDPNFAF